MYLYLGPSLRPAHLAGALALQLRIERLFAPEIITSKEVILEVSYPPAWSGVRPPPLTRDKATPSVTSEREDHRN